jgi:hypothetical protein
MGEGRGGDFETISKSHRANAKRGSIEDFDPSALVIAM